MKTIVIKDWYYENCVTFPVGSWFLDWGYCIVKNSSDKTIAAYRTLKGNVVLETEKAVCIETTAHRFNHHCDITKSMKWRIWMPKKGLVDNGVRLSYYDGGQGQYIDRDMVSFLQRHKDYKSIKTWAFK